MSHNLEAIVQAYRLGALLTDIAETFGSPVEYCVTELQLARNLWNEVAYAVKAMLEELDKIEVDAIRQDLPDVAEKARDRRLQCLAWIDTKRQDPAFAEDTDEIRKLGEEIIREVRQKRGSLN